MELTQYFGTGRNSPSGRSHIYWHYQGIHRNWLAKGNSYGNFAFSISGKTIGSNNDSGLTLIAWFDVGSDFNARTDTLGQQSGTFDIAQVQVEPGAVATAFERRPIGMELSLCQRYFCKSYNVNVNPGTITTDGQTYLEGASSGLAGIGQTTFFPVQMRGTPTITIYNPVTGASNSARRASSNVTPTIICSGERAFAFIADGTGADNTSGHWTASAEL
jgi:hypothetical protein